VREVRAVLAQSILQRVAMEAQEARTAHLHTMLGTTVGTSVGSCARPLVRSCAPNAISYRGSVSQLQAAFNVAREPCIRLTSPHPSPPELGRAPRFRVCSAAASEPSLPASELPTANGPEGGFTPASSSWSTGRAEFAPYALRPPAAPGGMHRRFQMGSRGPC
jgi:hypothetical protein